MSGKPYNDRCATCFDLLKPAPLGGHYACAEHPRSGYWSEAVPEEGSTEACLKSRYGRPTMYYYGGAFSLWL